MEGQLGSGNQALEKELTRMLEGVDVPENSKVIEKCIYMVPRKTRQTNPKAYTPQVVSIGPFHNPRGSSEDDHFLLPMEELKLKYLKGFLNRTPQLRVGNFVDKLRERESEIRSCYAGPVNYNSNDSLKMILIDACFIIEHFLRFYKFEDWASMGDPILLKTWLGYDIMSDLMLLENQLPFFVLEDIYNQANMNHEFPSFLEITSFYFKLGSNQKINPERVPKHITDLLTIFMLPSSPSFDPHKVVQGGSIENLYSVSQLLEAGLVFRASENKRLIDLEFDKGKGVLTMPCLHLHYGTEMHIRNILAFEECHQLPVREAQYIAEYFRILDFLINTEKDVNILVDKKIIVNWLGDANQVVTMVNNLPKTATIPLLSSKYHTLCHDLNDFYENPRNKYKVIFIHEYFNTPWRIASTIAAVLLLLLTLIQTICSVIPLFKR